MALHTSAVGFFDWEMTAGSGGGGEGDGGST